MKLMFIDLFKFCGSDILFKWNLDYKLKFKF